MKNIIPSGLIALGVSIPKNVVTNDDWWQRSRLHLEACEQAIKKQHFWRNDSNSDKNTNVFIQEMQPYLNDPFRGAIERRAMSLDEKILDYEIKASQRALAAANMSAQDIDCIVIASFFSDQLCPGNGIMLAKALDIKAPAWNVETACGGGVTVLSLACSLVASGQFKHVLAVTSCSYSRNITHDNPMAWSGGDAAAAMIVGPNTPGYGFLANQHINTLETHDIFTQHLHEDGQRGQYITLAAKKNAGRVLLETAETYLKICAHGALQKAQLDVENIDFFAVGTPNAWSAKGSMRCLGFSANKTIDTFAKFGNIGPALMPVNLYYAAQDNRIQHGDHVLLYGVGSNSSAGALITRWDHVAMKAEDD